MNCAQAAWQVALISGRKSYFKALTDKLNVYSGPRVRICFSICLTADPVFIYFQVHADLFQRNKSRIYLEIGAAALAS